MKVEIWSDIMCPFCYIGKKRFEDALQQFEHGKKVEIEWRSFQLDPHMQYIPGHDTYDMLSLSKGMSREQAKQLTGNVVRMAEASGLTINFDTSIPANTLDAHRLTHLASKYGLQNAAEEALFKAHFEEGKNISDHEVLAQIGESIGLEAAEVTQMLKTDDYKDNVRQDIYDAQAIGVRGVPYFVIDRRYAISGAQESSIFLSALQQSWDEHSGAAQEDDSKSCTVNDTFC
jgi:predicted DsbA family dithiol-disulfide isomerase